MHWLGRHRLLILVLIAVFWTGLVALAHFFPLFPVLSSIWSGESSFEDMLRRQGRRTQTHSDFVFLGIDQQSMQLDVVSSNEIAQDRALQLMAAQPFPWSREIWAILMDKLFGADARLIVFDMVFDKPNGADSVLRAALDKYRDRVVIGCNYNVHLSNDSTNNLTAELVLPNSSLIPVPQEKDDRVGFVNYLRDPDGILRRINFQMSYDRVIQQPERPGEERTSSMISRALVKLGRGDAIFNDVDPHALRFGSEDAYQPRPLYEVFLPATWHSNFKDGEFFKNKIVIVGPSAAILHDTVATPIDQNLTGAIMHLHSLAAAMDQEFLRDTQTKLDLILILAAGVLAWGLVGFSRHSRPTAM